MKRLQFQVVLANPCATALCRDTRVQLRVEHIQVQVQQFSVHFLLRPLQSSEEDVVRRLCGQVSDHAVRLHQSVLLLGFRRGATLFLFLLVACLLGAHLLILCPHGAHDLEPKFARAFENRYINLCKYYIDEGLQKAGIEPTAGDLADIAARRPPRSLFLDEHHENHFGYAIKAQLVFDKLKELGYISSVASINIQEAHPSSSTIYNLQGQKIGRVTKSGIYIVNGKKIFIKP